MDRLLYEVGLICIAIVAMRHVALPLWKWANNRSGLSGRFGKEQDNRNIDGPDDGIRHG